MADATTDLGTVWPALLRDHYGESFSIARRLAGLVTVPAAAAGARAGRHALGLADDAGAALDGQPGHRRGPRPRRPGLALGRSALARAATTGRRSADGRAAARKRQRVAAYAVILRDDADPAQPARRRSVTPDELWTLPGGGLDHGEDPRDAVVREVHEETGLDAAVGETARVYSAHLPGVVARRPPGRRARAADRVRRLGAGRRAGAARASRSAARRWRPPGTRSPTCSTAPCRSAPMVLEALADHRPFRHQRLGGLRPGPPRRRGAADPDLGARLPHRLLDPAGRRRRPRRAAARRAAARGARGVRRRRARSASWSTSHDEHFSGTAPSGRYEDFHAVGLVFEATVPRRRRAAVVEVGRHHRRGRVGAGRRRRAVPRAGARTGARRRSRCRSPTGDSADRTRRRAGMPRGRVRDPGRLGWPNERDRLHLRRPRAEVRHRRVRRGRPRPARRTAPAGCCWSPTRASRRPGTRPGSPSRSPPAASSVTTYDGAHVEPTDESLAEAIDVRPRRRAVRRDPGGRRRLRDRHRARRSTC